MLMRLHCIVFSHISPVFLPCVAVVGIAVIFIRCQTQYDVHAALWQTVARLLAAARNVFKYLIAYILQQPITRYCCKTIVQK